MDGGKHVFKAQIDLTQHEIINVRLQALLNLPTNPYEGQICYASHPDIKLGALWNGTEWTFFGLTLEQIEAINNIPAPFDPSEIWEKLEGLEPFQGYTPETLPISEATEEALELKADKQLNNVPIPLTWTFTGNKVYNLPTGAPTQAWTLSRVEKITMFRTTLNKDNLDYTADPIARTLTLGAGVNPPIGVKIFMELIFIIEQL